MTVLLGTLWCSIKHIEARFVFDWALGIALHPMQGNWALTIAEVDVSWDSRVVAGTWGTFSIYSENGHSKLHLGLKVRITV